MRDNIFRSSVSFYSLLTDASLFWLKVIITSNIFSQKNHVVEHYRKEMLQGWNFVLYIRINLQPQQVSKMTFLGGIISEVFRSQTAD
jgi:hypothetical protein